MKVGPWPNIKHAGTKVFYKITKKVIDNEREMSRIRNTPLRGRFIKKIRRQTVWALCRVRRTKRSKKKKL